MLIRLAIFAVLTPIIMLAGVLLSTKAGMKERGEACERTSGVCDCDCGAEQSQSSSIDSFDSYDSDDSYDPDEAARRLAAHPWWGLR
jgi:hypothetical protein